ncbi:hypothetical protein AB3X52_14390 [Nocardioides sp. DS6]|uniref:Uncharacterized protein n=1 Tax=Nocardioides eburneus TaxID=3231482 RepID=A0ABV3T0T9_9ACTN
MSDPQWLQGTRVVLPEYAARRRPRSVIAAGVIAILQCALAGFVAGFIMFFGGLILFVPLLALPCGLGVIVAALTIAGSNAGRILLTLAAGGVSLVCLVAAVLVAADGDASQLLTLFYAVWGTVAGLVVPLLYVGGANAWFAGRR